MDPADDVVITLTVEYRGRTATRTLRAPAAPISSQQLVWLPRRVRGEITGLVSGVCEDLTTAITADEET